MKSTNSQATYSPMLRYLHWGMFLLMVAVYASIEMREFFEKGTDMRNAFKSVHFMLGITVLVFVLLRVYSRLRQSYPPVSPALPLWQHYLSKAAHFSLYVLMIVMPIAGWLILSAEGKDIPFGLPALIGVNKSLAHDIEEFHELLGLFGYGLISLHIVAAAYHQLICKDNLLKRIWLKKG